MSLAELLSRPAPPPRAPDRIYGAVVGVVTSVDDPDGKGRVKVKLPWLKDDAESRWARLVSFMAGASRGAVFQPEVGEEVLLLFEHGDPRFPYIIGGVWNGTDAMPEGGGPDVRFIKTRSGHSIVLDDTSGSEKVTVTDKNGNKIELSSNGVVIESNAILLGSSGASEGLVLGNAFMQLFNGHTHPTGVGPSGPPTQQMASGQHVSSKHKAE